MDKQQQLDQVAEDILRNDVCPQLRAGASRLVPGYGNPDADVLFIGEAPGKREDAEGVPFVGAAGKFLDEMLRSIGMSREEVYITNIVKYRPPENRDPLPEEIADFMPFLVRQIAIIKPKVLVTLGRFSMNVFLPNQKISHIHGQPKRVGFKLEEDSRSEEVASLLEEKVVILPLYHPAAALYNGGQRQVLLDDFAQIPQVLDSLTT